VYGIKHFSARTLPTGFQATEKIGKYLKNKSIDLCVSSQYLRCRETAAIVSKHIHKDFIYDKRLNSYFIETPWHFRKRLQNFLNTIENADYQSVAICTHGLVLSVLVSLLTEKHFTLKDIFSPPLPGELLVIKNGQVEVISFN